jgi:hypothetical protein
MWCFSLWEFRLRLQILVRGFDMAHFKRKVTVKHKVGMKRRKRLTTRASIDWIVIRIFWRDGDNDWPRKLGKAVNYWDLIVDWRYHLQSTKTGAWLSRCAWNPSGFRCNTADVDIRVAVPRTRAKTRRKLHISMEGQCQDPSWWF